MSTAATTPTGGRELSQPPSDGISNLHFSNHSDLLLVSSWDKLTALRHTWRSKVVEQLDGIFFDWMMEALLAKKPDRESPGRQLRGRIVPAMFMDLKQGAAERNSCTPASKRMDRTMEVTLVRVGIQCREVSLGPVSGADERWDPAQRVNPLRSSGHSVLTRSTSLYNCLMQET